MSSTGISRWVDMPHKAFLWLLGQNPLLIITVLVPLLVTLVVFSLLDAVTTTCGIAWVLVAGGAGLLAILLKFGKKEGR